MSNSNYAVKKAVFSRLLLERSTATKLAYVGVFVALNIVENLFFEFKWLDIQFSFTIVVAIFSGVFLGPVLGFTSAFLGDLVGYFVNSWGYLYMPWVGLSTGMMAFIAGLVFNLIPNKGKGRVYLKMAITCLLTFLICTVAINSTGFYYYNLGMGFSKAVIEYVETNFGGNVTFFAYVCYRLVFKMQLVNSAFNYAVLFVMLVPMLQAVKPMRELLI